MQVSNSRIAQYLAEVADVYRKNPSHRIRSVASTYESASLIVGRMKTPLASMSRLDLTKIKGIGDSLSEAIFNYVRGISEPSQIARAREAQVSSSENDELAGYLKSLGEKSNSVTTRNAYVRASDVIRGSKEKIVSAEQAMKLPYVGPVTGKSVAEYFGEEPFGEILEATPETLAKIRESGAKTILEALSLDVDRIDRHLIYWKDDISAKLTESDAESLKEVFHVVVELDVEVYIDESSANTILVYVSDHKIEDVLQKLSPFVRKIIYETAGDVTVLFQANPRSLVRLLRIVNGSP